MTKRRGTGGVAAHLLRLKSPQTVWNFCFRFDKALTASATTAVSRRGEEASEAGKAWRIY